MSLLAKRQASRETVVEAGGHKWTLRRPTAYERAFDVDKTKFELICGLIVGWDLTELDLVPGGSPVPAAFDRDLLADYMGDHPELWKPLIDAREEIIKAHNAALEAAAKN